MLKSGSNIKVLVVDDIISFRERFDEILSSDDSIEVVGLASSGKEAVKEAIKTRPDVILMDIMMEDDDSGIEASFEINEKLPNVKIIISTVLEDDETVYNAFKTGAVDYLLKNASPNEVINAIHAAYNDNSPIRPKIAKKIRKEFKKMRLYQENIIYTLRIIRTLTNTELEILLMVCEGKRRKEIADVLCIELCTVKTHINRILKKFNKRSSREVADYLTKMCIVDIIRQSLYKK